MVERLKKTARSLLAKRYLRRSALLSLLAFLLVWITFFDTHSLVKRFTWRQESVKLAQENEQLRAQIEDLKAQQDANLSDETIERLARERYGMRKEGETVYKIEEIE